MKTIEQTVVCGHFSQKNRGCHFTLRRRTSQKSVRKKIQNPQIEGSIFFRRFLSRTLVIYIDFFVNFSVRTFFTKEPLVPFHSSSLISRYRNRRENIDPSIWWIWIFLTAIFWLVRCQRVKWHPRFFCEKWPQTTVCSIVFIFSRARF